MCVATCRCWPCRVSRAAWPAWPPRWPCARRPWRVWPMPWTHPRRGVQPRGLRCRRRARPRRRRGKGLRRRGPPRARVTTRRMTARRAWQAGLASRQTPPAHWAKVCGLALSIRRTTHKTAYVAASLLWGWQLAPSVTCWFHRRPRAVWCVHSASLQRRPGAVCSCWRGRRPRQGPGQVPPRAVPTARSRCQSRTACGRFCWRWPRCGWCGRVGGGGRTHAAACAGRVSRPGPSSRPCASSSSSGRRPSSFSSCPASAQTG